MSIGDSQIETNGLGDVSDEDKRRLCIGADFWSTVGLPEHGIPSIVMNDGPHGVRATRSSDIIVTDNRPATAFPTASALGATWNPHLVSRVASVIAREARSYGFQLLLGPGVNLKRSPLGGRNFEYFSEEPYLTGTLATAFVAGLQAEGVGACLKHFVCNEQEIERMTIDCIVDERAIREVYVMPFEMCIREAHPAAIMAAYNSLNGERVIESERYLTKLLRDELSFEGVIVSDWGAVRDEKKSSQAGLDLTMPGPPGNERLNSIPEEVLHRRAGRVAQLARKLAQPDTQPSEIDFERNYELAREAAEQSIVLLRNEDGLLPITEGRRSLGVVGTFFDKPRIQGGGSSRVLPHRTSTPRDILARRYPDVAVDYSPGSTIDEAVAVARRNELTIAFLGLSDDEETEGRDRVRYSLSEHEEELVTALLNANPRTVVVLNCGTAATFQGMERTRALVYWWLPGSGGGEALVRMLFGEVDPSGRLSETIPVRLEDFPLGTTAKSSSRSIRYGESILVGHRYYDFRGLPVAFPFGFGLSYTSFTYSDIQVSSRDLTDRDHVEVEFVLKNTGERSGTEVPQLYVEHVDSDVIKAPRMLRAFTKVALEAGESRRIRFKLEREDFVYYNDSMGEFFVDEGLYRVHIGRSSRDLPLFVEIHIHHSQDAERDIERRLTGESLGKEFLTTPRGRMEFDRAFTSLNKKGLYEIIKEMPLNLVSELFPDLVSPSQIEELLAAVQRQGEFDHD